MFDTVALSFLVACAIVVLGIPAALLEVYYFRIRKRRQQGAIGSALELGFHLLMLVAC